MEHSNHLQLTRYEKIEMGVLGIATPLCIFIWTLFNLIKYSEAIYVFHDEPVYFYGASAYLVCWFWIGLSLALCSHFALSKVKKHYALAKTLFKCGVYMVFITTLFAVFYTFELYQFLP
jgi:hypothetical protein